MKLNEAVLGKIKNRLLTNGLNYGSYWAKIKTHFLIELCEDMDIDRNQAMLVDDDQVNAKMANQFGFHAITTKDDPKGGGIEMTIQGLKKIIDDPNDKPDETKFTYLEPYDVTSGTPDDVTENHIKRIREKLGIKTDKNENLNAEPILARLAGHNNPEYEPTYINVPSKSVNICITPPINIVYHNFYAIIKLSKGDL